MTVENISIDVKTNAGGAAREVRSLSSALSGVRSASKSVASGGGAKGASKSIASVGHAAKSSTGFLSKFFASIKRIAFYRILRTLMKNITQGFQEGLKHAYAFSKALNGPLAQALDRISSASGQMKNQAGAALGELLRTIEPVINAIIGLVTKLLQALSALFAALGGRLTYSVAEKTADEWDAAAGSAKEYKNTVLGFDELNKLNDESGGGGGGGGAIGEFKDLDLPEWALKIKELMDKLKDLFSLGKYFEAGETLADWLNDLIDKWDAYETGKKLGKKINNMIQFAYGFLKKFNFKNLGKKIAEFFNGVLSEIDTETLGRALVRVFTGALDFLIGFIGGLDFAQLARKISDFLLGAFREATEWLTSTDWREVGAMITGKIHDFLTNIDWANLGVESSNFVIALFNSIRDFFDGSDWEQIGKDVFKALKDFVTNIDWKGIVNAAIDALGAAMSAASGFVKGILEESGLVSDIEGALEAIMVVLSSASMAIGAILLFTGHVPLGLGLIIAGLAGQQRASENWDLVPDKVKGIVGAIEGVASTALIALGLILTLTGANIPLGLGMIAVGGYMLATAAKENWEKVPGDVKQTLGLIGMVAGAALVGLGIILVLTGAGIPLGLGMILAGSAVLGITEKSYDIDSTKTSFTHALEDIGKSGSENLGKVSKELQTMYDLAIKVIGAFGNMNPLVSNIMNIIGTAGTLGVNFKAEGGTLNNDGTLFVAGEAGPEIVANMGSKTGVMNVDQMEAAVANGNMGVINAVYGMANMIVNAVNAIDPDITLDGESLADKMYRYNQNAATRRGMAMVT